jgi:hypothetical protein
MVTMIDEIYDRQYQASRKDLNSALLDALGRLGHAVGDAFKVLNRIEYSAPWANRPRSASFH